MDKRSILHVADELEAPVSVELFAMSGVEELGDEGSDVVCRDETIPICLLLKQALQLARPSCSSLTSS